MQNLEHRAVGKAAAQPGQGGVGQVDQPGIGGGQQAGQIHAQREHDAAHNGDQPVGDLFLKQTADDVAQHKHGDHDGGGHSHLAALPAVKFHYVGLKDRPHVQNAHAEHNDQAGNQDDDFLAFDRIHETTLPIIKK